MLERGPRTADAALRREDDEGERPSDDRLLVTYGRRLHGYLFGDGDKLRHFLQFNDSYRRQARLTLSLHPEAAALWRRLAPAEQEALTALSILEASFWADTVAHWPGRGVRPFPGELEDQTPIGG